MKKLLIIAAVVMSGVAAKAGGMCAYGTKIGLSADSNISTKTHSSVKAVR